MTRLFQANNPYNAFLLLIYGLLLKLPMFMQPVVPVVRSSEALAYRSFMQWMQSWVGNFPVVYAILAFVLIYVQAISLNRIANDKRLFQRPNYLVGMSYLLVSSLFADWNTLSAPLLVNTLVIWLWSKTISLYTNPNPRTLLFNLGFGVGLASFIFFPAIFLLLLVYAGLMIARPVRLAEWVMATLGFIAPYYFWLSGLFLTDRWGKYPLPGLGIEMPPLMQSPWMLAAVLLVAMWGLIGLGQIRVQRSRQVVQIRKAWSVSLVYGLLALVLPFINPSRDFAAWDLLAPVIALAFAGAFLYVRRGWIGNWMHVILVAFVLLFSYVLR